MTGTIREWLDLSQSDLESSRLLYDNKHFRNSYFMFQQATEKANKAFALWTGQFTEKELKDVQHDQLKIYRKTMVKEKDNINSLTRVLASYPKAAGHEIMPQTSFMKYSQALSDGISFIDSTRNHDLVHISVAELNDILRPLRKIKNTKLKTPRYPEKGFRTVLLKVADWIGQFELPQAVQARAEFLQYIEDREQVKQLYDLMLKQLFPLMIDLAFINYVLYICALITIQHSSLTRYPVNGTNPDTIYTRDLPLVKKQQEFMNILDEALHKFKRLMATEPEFITP